MIREWFSTRRQELEGHERSLQLATALAMKTDPDTMEKLLEVKNLLDSVGGQVYIAAFRNKYKTVVENGQLVDVPVDDPKDEAGKYVTDGYVFHYEHIAKLNRQRPEPDDKHTPDTLPTPEWVIPDADNPPSVSEPVPVMDTAESVQADG